MRPSATMNILALNPGSSSLKSAFVRFPGQATLPGEGATVGEIVAAAPFPIDAVGVRVVHGGARSTAPAVVDDDVLAAIGALAALAPLHNPLAAAAIEEVRRALPAVPIVA